MTQATPSSELGWKRHSKPLVPYETSEKLGRFSLLAITLGAFAFLYVPIIVLVVFSFNSARTGAVWQGFTLSWYERMINNERLIDAALKSLVIATVSTIIAVIIGTLTALAMERYRFRSKGAWDALLYMPVIVPEIVMGVSLAMFFGLVSGGVKALVTAVTGVEPEVADVRGFGTLVISHVAFSMPFVYLTVRARLADFDTTLEEAAKDLGANEMRTFMRITLPLLAPGIISGALLALTLSIDDFIISFFVNGKGWNTLPIYIWSALKQGVTPEINAVSTALLLFSILIVTLSVVIQRRQQ